jgi:hypothetical protein
MERAEYVMDKIDYLAYNASARNIIMMFLDTFLQVYAVGSPIYMRLMLLSDFYKSILPDIQTNKYYKALTL